MAPFDGAFAFQINRQFRFYSPLCLTGFPLGGAKSDLCKFRTKASARTRPLPIPLISGFFILSKHLCISLKALSSSPRFLMPCMPRGTRFLASSLTPGCVWSISIMFSIAILWIAGKCECQFGGNGLSLGTMFISPFYCSNAIF